MSEDKVVDGAIDDLAGIMGPFMDEHGDVQPVERLGRDDDPITVSVVKVQQSLSLTPINPQESKFVAVRPCDDVKTYLGMCLGDLPLPPMVAYSPKSQTLFVSSRTNPAMWVPDLNKVVWGYESWWGPIESEEQLKQITDDDIQNVWYVKALKMLGERKEEEDAEARAETIDD